MANDYERIMTILKKVQSDELECAKVTKELLKRTWNPIRRFSMKKSITRFSDHAFGIELAMHKLKKELES